MNLTILSRIENTSITPKIYNIYLSCSAKKCSKEAIYKTDSRFKGKKKCCYCPNAVMYVGLDRYDTKQVARVTLYTKGTFDSLSNSILNGSVHRQVQLASDGNKQTTQSSGVNQP